MRSILLILFLYPFIGYAQHSFSGEVYDREGQPIPYANVLLLQASDSALLASTTTDLAGKFMIQQKAGTYLLSVRMIGYKTHNSPVELSTPPSRTRITLEEQSTNLDEVIITAEKPLFEQHVDKLVVNVEHSLVSSGGSILDVLDRSPGITVNRQGGSISMNGKQTVQIMINGKLQRMPLSAVIQQLEGMPAGGVDKVELISNPASRYDAEGDGGIVNIVTKKSIDNGTSGTAMAGLGYSHLSHYVKPITSVNVNHKRNGVTWSGSYSMNGDRRWQQWNYERQTITPDLYSNTTTDRHVWWPIQRASFNVDWSIAERTTLSALVSGFNDLWKMESHNQSNVKRDGSDSATIYLFDKETNHWKHLMGNVSMNHRFKNNGRIAVDLDYLYYHDRNPNDFTNDYTFHSSRENIREFVRTDKTTPIRMVVGKFDYERTIHSFKVEAGIKTTLSTLHNYLKLENKTGEQWVPDEQFTQDYTLTDNVNAVYISTGGNFGKRSQVQLGLRAESTEMHMTVSNQTLFNLDFWKLFPTAFYTWRINANSSFQLSYGKRINRPAYTSVAPFVIFMDPFTYYWGNLKLQPAISNSIQATYLHKDLQLLFKYSRDKNAIAGNQSRYNAEDEKTYIYADNVDRLSVYSLSAVLPVQIVPWWKTQNSVMVNYQQTHHNLEGQPLHLRQYSMRLSTNQTLTLPHNFMFDVTGIYVAPRRIGRSLLKTVIEVSAGLQKKISDRSRMALTITDIFWTRNSIYVNNNPALGQIQKTSYYNEPRVWRLSYTHRLGTDKLKSKQRVTASETEQQRVN